MSTDNAYPHALIVGLVHFFNAQIEYLPTITAGKQAMDKKNIYSSSGLPQIRENQREPAQYVDSIPKNSSPIPPNLSVLIGLSGGLDSIVLLHLMVELQRLLQNRHGQLSTYHTKDAQSICQLAQFSIQSIRALYVHHGLSEHADDWAEHCEQVCHGYDIDFLVKRVVVDAKSGGVEAGARSARYEAFKQTLLSNELLLTAQHQDDQAETFLLALKRGSGPLGLGAMVASRQLETGHWHMRPLLSVSRQALTEFAIQQSLRWIDDESNQDDRYDRNFLRLHIFPKLLNRWPHLNQAIAKSALLCQSQERLLDELLLPMMAALIDEENGSLAIEPMCLFSEDKRVAVLRRWCQQQLPTMPTSDQIRRIWHEVALSREDSEAMVEMGCHQEHLIQVRRYQNRLYFIFLPRNVITLPAIVWLEEQKINVPGFKDPITQAEIISELARLAKKHYLSDLDKQCYLTELTEGRINLRFNLPNSTKIMIYGHNQTKTLKKIWQAFHVAPWMRSYVPFIFVEDTMIMAYGLFIASMND